MVAASLVVGGAAGVGGAAAWDTWNPDASSSTAAPAARTTSSVVSAPTGTAAHGSVEQVAQQVLPSVVKIDVSNGQEAGSGSGIILSSDGQILTNNHVVEVAGQSGSIRVSFNDGTSAPARILGTDPLTDTAVIQAQDVNGLTPATIGKSSELRVGQGVVAIGSPFGLESTVTSGIVSALDRPVAVGSDVQGNSTTYPAIQTDAAINPGNSGGPLVDLAGRVVGIDAAIKTTSTSTTDQGGSIGLGFAIPIDEVMPIVDQMVKGETPTHARLGITVSDVANPTGGPRGRADPAGHPRLHRRRRRPRPRRRHHQGGRPPHQQCRLAGGDDPFLPPRRHGHGDLPARRRHEDRAAPARLRRGRPRRLDPPGASPHPRRDTSRPR